MPTQLQFRVFSGETPLEGIGVVKAETGLLFWIRTWNHAIFWIVKVNESHNCQHFAIIFWRIHAYQQPEGNLKEEVGIAKTTKTTKFDWTNKVLGMEIFVRVVFYVWVLKFSDFTLGLKKRHEGKIQE